MPLRRKSRNKCLQATHRTVKSLKNPPIMKLLIFNNVSCVSEDFFPSTGLQKFGSITSCDLYNLQSLVLSHFYVISCKKSHKNRFCIETGFLKMWTDQENWKESFQNITDFFVFLLRSTI